MTLALEALSWPVARASEAVAAVVAQGFAPHSLAASTGVALPLTGNDVAVAVRAAGLEATEVVVTSRDIERFLTKAGPAVLLLPGEERLLVLLGRRGSRPAAALPDGTCRVLPRGQLATLLRADAMRAVGSKVEVEAALGLTGERGERIATALRRVSHEDAALGRAWLARLPATENFWRQLRAEGLLTRLTAMLAAHVMSPVLIALSVVALGNDVLVNGRVDQSRIMLWSLLLLASGGAMLVALWQQSSFGFGLAVLTKRRMLEGAFRIPNDVTRLLGVGALVGEVHESEAAEDLARSPAFETPFAVAQLAAAAALLWLGPARWAELTLLGLFTAAAVSLTALFTRAKIEWTDERIAVTNDFVEKVVGHRTRVTQQATEHWHTGEAEAAARYADASRSVDQYAVGAHVLPRVWVLTATAALTPSLLASSGGPAATTGIAISLFGLLLATQSLQSLVVSLFAIADFMVAWRRVRRIFTAGFVAATRPMNEPPLLPGAAQGPLVELVDVSLRYRPESRPALRGCNLLIARGDRILVRGPSGGGKTTLAALIAGIRAPTSGVVLVDGLDPHSLSPERWKRLVAAAPQYYENHIFSNTLAFNLLLGRAWPPSSSDLSEAEEVCEALGLSALVDSMPLRLDEPLGEGGWRLSHGEKSRVYLARSLLQRAELVILDETFAALDPVTLERCLGYVLAKTRTLVVIEHL